MRTLQNRTKRCYEYSNKVPTYQRYLTLHILLKKIILNESENWPVLVQEMYTNELYLIGSVSMMTSIVTMETSLKSVAEQSAI